MAFVAWLCNVNNLAAELGGSHERIVFQNPRVYNVDYSFEMTPDPKTIDRTKDLKVWIPVPVEWDSQKAVRIISVSPEPDARYVDPEYGNKLFFWDFGRRPEQTTYKLNIQFRLESYEMRVTVDPKQVGSYDTMAKEYALYTRSTPSIHITPKITELAREAVGDETNPYRQAERISQFVEKKVRFKILDYDRGRGIDVLLAYPVTDEKTGQEYYEGCCTQVAALKVALCRAVGIPARCVSAFMGWNPWIEPNEAKPEFAFEAKVSPAGLAATQLYGGLDSHMWSEFFIPNYGWIPDRYGPAMLGRQNNQMWIKEKDRDVLLGPGPPPKNDEGYGVHWVPLHDGKADLVCYAILNVAKIHRSKATVLHHSDPFPADGLASYNEILHPLLPQSEYEDVARWRVGVLSWPSCYVRDLRHKKLDLARFYKDHPAAKQDREAFVCHMLRRQMGQEKFSQLGDAYLALRLESGRPVPTSRFQELAENISGEALGWFFEQWVNRNELPRLRLAGVSVAKQKDGWRVRGQILQSGDVPFRLPLELAIDTAHGREGRLLQVAKRSTPFEFHVDEEPQRLTVDPDDQVLKVQKIPAHLWWYSDMSPKVRVIYGTSLETEANRTAAERLNSELLGLGQEIVKADTDIHDSDLKADCIFLVGRPEANTLSRKLQHIFPVKFDKNTFAWKGRTYAEPMEAVAQIVEKPRGAHNLIIMLAALSAQATQRFPYAFLGRSDRSYVIFDGDKQLLQGDWEGADPDLVYDFQSSSAH